MNGEPTDFFPHKRGLRQGDPLSPMLFNIAADVFQQMIIATNGCLQGGITGKVKESLLAFQYADDTAVVASANVSSLISLKLVFRLFASVSGLKINYNKSTFIPLNVDESQLPWVRAVLGCSMSNFPIIFLGLPLTIKKPTREMFMPLVERVEQKLRGWKGKFISRGGRHQLVQSVLSTIPVYYMMCFRIPQWAIRRIDKARQLFLWGKSIDNSKGISLINWEITRMPKEWGGLGLLNLHVANIALLLRWWWKLYHEPTSLWTGVIMGLRRRGQHLNGPKFWFLSGSFFWSQLNAIKRLFSWCTSWSIGDGNSISFWFDSWTHSTSQAQISEVQNPYLSLREAWPIRETLDPDRTFPEEITFCDGQDTIFWRWETSGIYRLSRGTISYAGAVESNGVSHTSGGLRFHNLLSYLPISYLRAKY